MSNKETELLAKLSSYADILEMTPIIEMRISAIEGMQKSLKELNECVACSTAHETTFNILVEGVITNKIKTYCLYQENREYLEYRLLETIKDVVKTGDKFHLTGDK